MARTRRLLFAGIAVLAIAVAAIAFGRFGLFPGQQVAERYPEPRFPSYLKAPKSVDEALPFARSAVRQSGGRTPLGLVRSGQTTLLVLPNQSEDIIIEALKRAYEERGVKVQTVGTWELKGVTRDQEAQLARAEQWWTQEQGFVEVFGWFRAFADQDRVKAWLRQVRPDLYEALYPKIEKPNIKARDERAELVAYLDKHPEVDAVFWGFGGRPSLRQALGRHGEKLYGNFTYFDRWEVMSKVPSYPSDVWRLSEEKTIEPLRFFDRAEVKDPQGTDFAFDVDERMAEVWSKGVYLQGHLFMYPAQASGRRPSSFIEFPKLEEEFLRPVQPRVNGVFAGTTNHAGFFPRIEVVVKDGYIQDVKGGGLYGELWRTFLTYPRINETQYPLIERPGYWFLYEAGTGTSPKYFGGPHSSERNVGGVVHWGFGVQIEDAPDDVKRAWDAFARERGLPGGHWMHIHNVLPTYRGRIRGTGQWVTIIDKGRLTALDSPEVRALAARYGDPDEVLRQEWVRNLPGINAPGSYAEYAANPWPFEKRIDEEIAEGTYRYFSK